MVGCAVPEFRSECPSVCLSVRLSVGGWQNPEHWEIDSDITYEGQKPKQRRWNRTLHSVDREIEITFSHDDDDDDTEEHQKQWH